MRGTQEGLEEGLEWCRENIDAGPQPQAQRRAFGGEGYNWSFDFGGGPGDRLLGYFKFKHDVDAVAFRLRFSEDG